MIKVKSIEFSRAGLEIIIVVVGILITLGLDSWWDSTRQRVWERSQLELLRDGTRSMGNLDRRFLFRLDDLAHGTRLLSKCRGCNKQQPAGKNDEERLFTHPR